MNSQKSNTPKTLAHGIQPINDPFWRNNDILKRPENVQNQQKSKFANENDKNRTYGREYTVTYLGIWLSMTHHIWFIIILLMTHHIWLIITLLDLNLHQCFCPIFYVNYCIRVWKKSSFAWSVDAEMGQIWSPCSH